MFLSCVTDISLSEALLRSMRDISLSLKKKASILLFIREDSSCDREMKKASQFIEDKQLGEINVIIRNSDIESLSEICEELEVSFLFIQLSNEHNRMLRKFLNACRGLRIPYLFFKPDFDSIDMEKILVPVTFLEEEYEKGQFASAFGRFCRSFILLLQANDYGSKARITVKKMTNLFDKFDLDYMVEKAQYDSFKVEKEAITLAQKEHAGMVLLSASRDYGLDDLLFGPKEFHLIKKSTIPLLLINPRGDLYSLCD